MADFTCHFENCTFKNKSLEQLILHSTVVHGYVWNFKVRCCHTDCWQYFFEFKKYISHIQSKHTSTSFNYNLFKCIINGCYQLFDSIETFLNITLVILMSIK